MVAFLLYFAAFIFVCGPGVCVCACVWYEILFVSVSKEQMYSTQTTFALLNVRREHLHAFLLTASENVLILASKMINTSYCYTRHP